jgi:hypothetical protein
MLLLILLHDRCYLLLQELFTSAFIYTNYDQIIDVMISGQNTRVRVRGTLKCQK